LFVVLAAVRGEWRLFVVRAAVRGECQVSGGRRVSTVHVSDARRMVENVELGMLGFPHK